MGTLAKCSWNRLFLLFFCQSIWRLITYNTQSVHWMCFSFLCELPVGIWAEQTEQLL